MTTELTDSARGFWYADETPVQAVDVLNALRRYRTAVGAAQRRAREAIGVGESAMQALRILLDAERTGLAVNSKELAERLGISAASTSTLVDRLVRSGHLERHPDPNDRRGVVLTATGIAMRRARLVIDELDDRTRAAAEGATDDEIAVVIAFLDGMSDAVDDIAPDTVPRGPRA